VGPEVEERVDAQGGGAVVRAPTQKRYPRKPCPLAPVKAHESRRGLYPRGFSTTVAKGGRQTLIEAGRPWLEKSSAVTPGPLPMLLPP
jgi:hypothetical protein